MELAETTTAWLAGLLLGATLAHRRSRGLLTLVLGLPWTILLGFALVGKADARAYWALAAAEVGRLIATGLWLPGAIGAAMGIGLADGWLDDAKRYAPQQLGDRLGVVRESDGRKSR